MRQAATMMDIYKHGTQREEYSRLWGRVTKKLLMVESIMCAAAPEHAQYQRHVHRMLSSGHASLTLDSEAHLKSTPLQDNKQKRSTKQQTFRKINDPELTKRFLTQLKPSQEADEGQTQASANGVLGHAHTNNKDVWRSSARRLVSDKLLKLTSSLESYKRTKQWEKDSVSLQTRHTCFIKNYWRSKNVRFLLRILQWEALLLLGSYQRPCEYLDVGGILVGLISGSLQFLTNPGLDLIHVPAELLQGLGFTQLRPLLDHLGLQPAPPFTHYSLWLKEVPPLELGNHWGYAQTSLLITNP